MPVPCLFPAGSDDHTVRVWEVDTGRCFAVWHVGGVVDCVRWNPIAALPVLAACVGSRVLLFHSLTGPESATLAVEELFKAEEQKTPAVAGRTRHATWTTADEIEAAARAPVFSPAAGADTGADAGSAGSSVSPLAKSRYARLGLSRVEVDVGHRVRSLTWHAKGDYFATVSTPSSSLTVTLIHRLGHKHSQSPFSKSKGLVQKVLFHPSKPFFFVATQRNIRVYNLVKQQVRPVFGGMSLCGRVTNRS